MRSSAPAIFFVALLFPSLAIAGSIDQSTQYFAVRGATLSELDRNLSRSGPLISQTGQRHPGATSVQFSGSVSYKQGSDGCKVDKTHIALNLEVTLPKWVRPKRVARRTALIWQTLADDIARHEKRHADIAKNYLKRMESALRNLAPERSCDAMEATANRVMARYLERHEHAQIEFDTIEGRDMGLRLRRALRQSLAENQ